MRNAFSVAAVVVGLGCGAEEPVSTEAPLPPLVLSAQVDRASATTGDVITYTVTVDRDPGAQVEVPDFGAGIEGFRIEDIEQNDRPYSEGGQARDRRDHVYELRADLIGSYVLPALEVAWKLGEKSGKAQTPAIFVEVKTVLEEGQEATLRDLKPLAPLPQPFPYWVLGVMGGALAILLLALALWRKRRKRPEQVTVSLPEHVVVLEQLRGLEGFSAHDDAEAVRAHYFVLSELLRRYVESRFALPATDRTTPELARELRDSMVPRPVREDLLEICGSADLVKFADARPSADDNNAALRRILDLVERTWPVQEPALPAIEVAEEVA